MGCAQTACASEDRWSSRHPGRCAALCAEARAPGRLALRPGTLGVHPARRRTVCRWRSWLSSMWVSGTLRALKGRGGARSAARTSPRVVDAMRGAWARRIRGAPTGFAAARASAGAGALGGGAVGFRDGVGGTERGAAAGAATLPAGRPPCDSPYGRGRCGGRPLSGRRGRPPRHPAHGRPPDATDSATPCRWSWPRPPAPRREGPRSER